MGFWTIFVLLCATALISKAVSVDGKSNEDGNSMAALANNMDRKFEQIFQRFDQLEMKVNKIMERQNEESRCSGGVVDDNGGDEGATEDPVRPDSGSMEGQINSSLNEVDRLQRILFQRESSFLANLAIQ